MTVLGAVFAILTVVVIAARGRRGLVYVLAASVPFSDSAVAVFAGYGMQPYFAVLIVYLGLYLFDGLRRCRKHTGRSEIARTSVKLFYLYAIAITAFAPAVFSGTRVVASGLGLDEQVGALSILEYTSSNLAQMVYLTLSVALVLVNEADGLVRGNFFVVAFGVGIATATFCALFDLSTMYSWLFDSSPRNHYAELGSFRLRAQFAEPSHLGAFSAAAAVFFGFRAALFDSRWLRAVFIVGAVCAVWMLYLTHSGTGVVGLLVACLVITCVWLARFFLGMVSVKSAIPGILVAIGLVASYPWTSNWVRILVSEKDGTVSSITRSYVDANGVEVFFETAWFGSGLGSNRTSSLFHMLLSTVGLIGLLLFITLIAISVLICLSVPDLFACGMALLTLVAASFVSLADFTSPLLWSLVAACVAGGDVESSGAGRVVSSTRGLDVKTGLGRRLE